MTTLKAGKPSEQKKGVRLSKKEARTALQKPIEAETGPDLAKMNINLPKDFYKRIKRRALDQDISVKVLVIRAIEAYLSK